MRITSASFLAIAGLVGCASSNRPATLDDPGAATDSMTSPETTGADVAAEPPASDTSSDGDGWGAALCPVSGPATGFAVGNRIGSLKVVDCDTGIARSLDEVCGAQATWVFVAHSHCPTCQATAGFTPEVAKATADKNVAIVHILYDDVGITCPAWRKKFGLGGLPKVRVFVDPTGAAWSALKLDNYTAPSAFLDRNRVITYKRHGVGQTQALKEIDNALAH